MPDDKNDKKNSAKKSWSTGGEKPVLFKPDELDIYCNKLTLEAFIFHGKPVDYSVIDHFEYDHKNYTVDVVLKNKTRMDLGVKVEWMVRAYLSQAKEICIAQTKDGKSLAGTVLTLKHINKK